MYFSLLPSHQLPRPPATPVHSIGRPFRLQRQCRATINRQVHRLAVAQRQQGGRIAALHPAPAHHVAGAVWISSRRRPRSAAVGLTSLRPTTRSLRCPDFATLPRSCATSYSSARRRVLQAIRARGGHLLLGTLGARAAAHGHARGGHLIPKRTAPAFLPHGHACGAHIANC